MNRSNLPLLILIATAGFSSSFISVGAFAADWSSTEFHYQYGNLKKVFQGGQGPSKTGGSSILTLQHSSGWQYGDNFFFIDHSNYGKTDFDALSAAPSDDELYAELYSNFSLEKITGKSIKLGFIDDIGLVAGVNLVPEIDTVYYLPGVRLALTLPGFSFANLDITARIQNNSTKFAVKEEKTYMLDFSWAYPFAMANTRWSLEGHIEYTHAADQSVYGIGIAKRDSWLLAQTQLRFDVGHLWGSSDQLFVGIEYQYWRNKLGDPNTNENVPQFLLAWRF